MGGGAILQVLPGQVGARALGDQIDMGSMMSPAPLARPELHLAVSVAHLGRLAAGSITAVMVAAFAAIGVGGLHTGRARRPALAAGAAAGLVFWVLCQGFGGLSTGSATDPNTGPLLVLFAVAVAAVTAQVPSPGARAPHATDRRILVEASRWHARRGGRGIGGAAPSADCWALAWPHGPTKSRKGGPTNAGR